MEHRPVELKVMKQAESLIAIAYGIALWLDANLQLRLKAF